MRSLLPSGGAWPPVTVLIVTYDRPDEVRAVVGALRNHLRYLGKLCWHLADDSTGDPSYVPSILRDFPDLTWTYTVTPQRGGWGVNVNTALQAVQTPYVFLCEDDHVAQRPLDLGAGVFVMEHVPTVGLVRYDGVEGHRLTLHLEETPKVQGVRVHYLRADRLSSKELYVYSHRPHLKHKRFHEAYGLYTEGVDLGSTETLFAHRVRTAEAGPEIVVLSDGVERAFKHIGASRQGTAEDIGRRVRF